MGGLGELAFIADYLARFRNTDGKLELPMPAIIGTGMRAATCWSSVRGKNRRARSGLIRRGA